MMVDLLYYLSPVFVGIIAVEQAILWRRDPRSYSATETLGSFWLGLGNLATTALAAGFMLSFWRFCFEFRLFDLHRGVPYYVGLFVACDLMFYVYHRCAHEIRWFWAAHVNHHSSTAFNFATSIRETWTGALAGDMLFRGVLVLVGFSPEDVAVTYSIQLTYAFFLHTEWIGRMPVWIEAVFSTPSHHRVHHGSSPECLDKNFGGVFIVWDRLFGTFRDEADVPQLTYGATEGPNPRSLLSLPFHEWADMLLDVWHAPWRYKAGYLFMRPGWKHSVGGLSEVADVSSAEPAPRTGCGVDPRSRSQALGCRPR